MRFLSKITAYIKDYFLKLFLQPVTLAGIANGVLLSAGVILVLYGVLVIITDDSALPKVTLCLTAGLVLLFAATVDRFESLKGLGVEAKIQKRELKETISEAGDLIKRINKSNAEAGLNLLRLIVFLSPPRPGVTIKNSDAAMEFYDLAQNGRRLCAEGNVDPRQVQLQIQRWVDANVHKIYNSIAYGLSLFIEISRLRRNKQTNDPIFGIYFQTAYDLLMTHNYERYLNAIAMLENYPQELSGEIKPYVDAWTLALKETETFLRQSEMSSPDTAFNVFDITDDLKKLRQQLSPSGT